MCGIIGHIGKQQSSPLMLKALRKLEYRGYDSVGMATWQRGNIHLRKGTGKVAEVEQLLKLSLLPGTMGIGHTRWATTGQVNAVNAHPHVSTDSKICVVHNGIIENHNKLRTELKEKGYTFRSETDTEIIPQLIHYYMSQGNSFPEAFDSMLLDIEGNYAIVAIHQNHDGILFAKDTSPLVIGVGEDEFFLASDAPAFMEHTRKAIYLEDGDHGELNGTISIFDRQGQSVDRQSQELKWNVESAQKGVHAHFMLKEIYEQAQTIKKAIDQDPVKLHEITAAINEGHGIFFLACGTSYHACRVASYLFAQVAKRHVNLALASEFSNYTDFLTEKTLVIAVSQSGETADVIDAVKAAKKKGVKLISITNVMGSTLMRMADLSMLMNAGPEICVLSTKSYTSQVALLTLLAYSSVGKKEEAIANIHWAAKQVPSVISENLNQIQVLAKAFKDSKDIFVIGRDIAYPSALEGALKIKEVSYIHAEGFAGGELKHGSIALIEKGVPALVLVTEKTRSQVLSNAEEIRSRGGVIVGIDTQNQAAFDFHISIPNNDPLLMILPIQLLSYYLALERNCDPDKPRNLAKSVTVR